MLNNKNIRTLNRMLLALTNQTKLKLIEVDLLDIEASVLRYLIQFITRLEVVDISWTQATTVEEPL